MYIENRRHMCNYALCVYIHVCRRAYVCMYTSTERMVIQGQPSAATPGNGWETALPKHRMRGTSRQDPNEALKCTTGS